jgi:hypothetical protein
MNLKKPLALLSVAGMLALSPMAFAQNDTSGQTMGHSSRHALMMQKMTEACTDKKAKDPCSFDRPNGNTVSGLCETRHSKMMCIPSGMMHHHGMSHMSGNMMGGSTGSTGATGSPGSTGSTGGTGQ